MEEVSKDLAQEANQAYYYDVLKQVTIFGVTLFTIYFIFILPGSVSPEELTQYNWLNQGLIEYKNIIINYFSTSKPGTNYTTQITNLDI